MLADDRQWAYSKALQDWSVPAEDSAKNWTNNFFDYYFFYGQDLEFSEHTLPELWSLMENQYFDMDGVYPGFNQIGREWRVRALERAIEIVEVTL